MIDLHVHTTASDGTMPPEAVLLLAAATDIEAIAITDHDTCAGVRALADGYESGDPLPVRSGVTLIPGVEISCSTGSEVHILGLGVDINNPGLTEMFHHMRTRRLERGALILDKLKKLGADISHDMQEPSPNRVLIAASLVKHGYSEDISSAFREYLSKGGKAYVEKKNPACAEAIEAIVKAGGIAVWAHPREYLLGKDSVTWLARLEEMQRAGLRGLECYHGECPHEAADALRRIAKRYKLLVTGGSDFHGAYKPNIQMGAGLYGWHDWRTCYEELLSIL